MNLILLLRHKPVKDSSKRAFDDFHPAFQPPPRGRSADETYDFPWERVGGSWRLQRFAIRSDPPSFLTPQWIYRRLHGLPSRPATIRAERSGASATTLVREGGFTRTDRPNR